MTKYYQKDKTVSASLILAIASYATKPSVLYKAIIQGKINKVSANFLIDTGSSETIINHEFVIKNKFNKYVATASSSLTSPINYRIYCR